MLFYASCVLQKYTNSFHVGESVSADMAYARSKDPASDDAHTFSLRGVFA